MNKRFCGIIIALFLSFTPLFGQMILTEEDVGFNSRVTTPSQSLGIMVPLQGVDYDQWEYSPLGDGWLLLAGLGGAYLLKKKRSKK